ncbi:hypothetical protein KUH03_15770 [Sphingobacterium sp. E70]|uniref:hypothetical protein n=1 Tax=Sphingobacterium sp. E70 TaxID=2853439 RepID=UPI00211BA3E9|nr:hypothetical protein [Sphingobacterium sp. E70]ULT27941.1 hypothetical protein KUH03_15770 [Sphingobacterium sp. E70]
MKISSRRDFLKNVIGASSMLLLSQQGFAVDNRYEEAFIDKLLPAPKGGGFAMADYWIWDPSVIKGKMVDIICLHHVGAKIWLW